MEAFRRRLPIWICEKVRSPLRLVVHRLPWFHRPGTSKLPLGRWNDMHHPDAVTRKIDYANLDCGYLPVANGQLSEW